MHRRAFPKFLLASAATMTAARAARSETESTAMFPKTSNESALGIVPRDYSYQPGNVLRYLRSGDDASAAAQDCLRANSFCYLPTGKYSMRSTVHVDEGQAVFGEGQKNTIIESPPETHTFVWHPSGAMDRKGPSFRDLEIRGDYPITINSLTAFLANGNGDSPCKGSTLQRLTLRSPRQSKGYGICASKMFDSTITECEIVGFSIAIVLNGCDINEIYNNRFVAFSRFGILERSGQTFGSQNEIAHNDIVSPADGVAAYIKSTSRHVRIYDNYMEGPKTSCIGFVDLTNDEMPDIFGENSDNQRYMSIVVRDNRIDAENKALRFVYRIEPNQTVTLICQNSSTTGVRGRSYFTSEVLARYNGSHCKSMQIDGESWGIWNGYRSRQAYSTAGSRLFCTGENLEAIINKDGNSKVVIRGTCIVLPAEFSGNAWVIPNAIWGDNRLFHEAMTYTGKVLARSTAGQGDVLYVAVGGNGFGHSLNEFKLTNQFAEYTWRFRGAAASRRMMGFYLKRSGAAGDIEIASIGFE